MVQGKQLDLEHRPIKGLIAIEKIMAAYCGLTLLLALFFIGKIETAPVINRLYIILGTAGAWGLYRIRPGRTTYYIRVFYQVALLAYWYPDIYYYARFMPNTDHIFAAADQVIFGCQPSIILSQVLGGIFWKELFNMGYFSYYIMIFAVVLWAAFRKSEMFDRTACVVLFSFMAYYTIYLFLQSAGPQFYFQHIGMDNVQAGIFPNAGDWFQTHSELVHDGGTKGGLFTSLVEIAQQSEKPIAAFPSSHVGLSTIIIVLAWKLSHRLFAVFLPFYCILCISTVYIGAHYAIDVLGGWVSAAAIYCIAQFSVCRLLRKG